MQASTCLDSSQCPMVSYLYCITYVVITMLYRLILGIVDLWQGRVVDKPTLPEIDPPEPAHHPTDTGVNSACLAFSEAASSQLAVVWMAIWQLCPPGQYCSLSMPGFAGMPDLQYSTTSPYDITFCMPVLGTIVCMRQCPVGQPGSVHAHALCQLLPCMQCAMYVLPACCAVVLDVHVLLS